MADDMVVFGGSGSPKLTRKICDYLKIQPCAGEVIRFTDDSPSDGTVHPALARRRRTSPTRVVTPEWSK